MTCDPIFATTAGPSSSNSRPTHYGTEAERGYYEPGDGPEIAFVAESFEAFMYRFWLENEIWFAEWKKTPMPDVGREYIESYRGNPR